MVAGCGDKPRTKPSASGITITDAVLVAPASGAASLSAKIANNSWRHDEIARITARRGSDELPVYSLGWEGLSIGHRNVLSSAELGDAVVVREVRPGQKVSVEFTFKYAPKARIEVPVVADGPKFAKVHVYRHPLPTITDGRFVVIPGQRCAFVGYTADGHGVIQSAALKDIRVTRANGQNVAWKHVTATGGPAAFIATEEPMSTEPADWAPSEVCDEPGSGDADYIEAAEVKVGETVTVAIEFPAGVVRAPFRIVRGQA